jgi:Antp family protein
MDANNFVMSSYQFVNSLAQCYPNNASNTTNSTTSNGPQNDYSFPGSAYNPNLYTGAPQSHYPSPQGYNPLAASTNAQQQPGSTEMVDYTQLQPQKFMLNQQQALGQSCKYAGDGQGTGTPNINQTSISSPQDLSTARDISPKLSPSSVVESAARSLNKQQHSTNNNNTNIANNNSKTSNTNSTSNSHLQSTTALPMRSPDGDESDASSDSGTEGGSGTGSGKKSELIK